jgi:beta-phosphoglucomutase-like phosphatase (HAD superfamily)
MNKDRFSRYRHVFWDFDGVIKESVSIKEDAYCALFLPFGAAVAGQVRQHHREHGGMSRFDKIPHYFRAFAGVEPGAVQLDDALKRFETLVFRKVIDCPWVPGARELILGNPWQQRFYLVTATPKEEIERILAELGLAHAFDRVAGAPEEKASAIEAAMNEGKLAPQACVMIGDSRADHAAARRNGIDFLLRDTPENAIMQSSISMDFRVKDLAYLAGLENPQSLPAKS